MPAPNRDVPAIFEELLSKLKKEIPGVLASKPWFDRLYVQKFSAFFHYLSQLLIVLDAARDDSNRFSDTEDRILSCDQVKRLHSLLYEVVRANVRYLSPGIPSSHDDYETSPLVVIYLGVASCVLFLRDFFSPDGTDYYHMCPQDIEYCIDNELNVVSDIPIKNFSLQELTCSLMNVEQRAHDLTYSEHLVDYIDALDARVCEFLVYALDEVSHNIESCRVRYRSTDLYTCATSTEYQLVILIMSLRQLVETAVPVWRTDSSLSWNRDADDNLLIETARNKFIVELQSVHSDIVSDKFYKEYTQRSIANSEGYLFLKANAIASRIEPGSIIRQFRTIPQWRHVADMAARPVVDFLFAPHADFLGFKIAFNLATDLVFSQTIKASWSEFSADGDTIRAMDDTQFDTFVEESYQCPVVLFLLNDACIFYKGQLTIYGRRHTDYYHALIQWVTIVRQNMNGEFRPCRSIMPLAAALFNETRTPPSSSSTSTGDEDFDSLSDSMWMPMSKIIDEMQAERREFRPPPEIGTPCVPLSVFMEKSRAKKEFEHIIERIETRPQELDANSILGDTDETGFPQTCRSAW
jgi:hypothetical protein